LKIRIARGESFRLGLPGLAVAEAFSDAAISIH
jgi:hypothetical protein